MSVRSALYVSAVIFGLALLILIISLGAIIAVCFPNRRPGFSYVVLPEPITPNHWLRCRLAGLISGVPGA